MTVTAEQIAAAIQAPRFFNPGPRYIWLVNCKVTGNLKLTGEHANFHVVFQSCEFDGDVQIAEAIFKRLVFEQCRCKGLQVVKTGLREQFYAMGAVFGRPVVFDQVEIAGDFWADTAGFEDGLKFDRVTCRECCYFTGARATTFCIVNTDFRRNVILDGLSCSTGLALTSSNFYGHVYGKRITTPRFELRRLSSPVVFERRVSFQSLKCTRASFSEAHFRDHVDLSACDFGRYASFAGVTFGDSVDFVGVAFPAETNFDGARFGQPLRVRWEQVCPPRVWWRPWHDPKPRMSLATATTWETLEDAFRRAGNLQGQNEAIYYRRAASAGFVGADRENFVRTYLSRCFWGFGLRPSRTFLWLIGIVIGFGLIYLARMSPRRCLGDRWNDLLKRDGLSGGGVATYFRREWLSCQFNARAHDNADFGNNLVARLWAALIFSLNVSWKISYGWQNSTTPVMKAVTATHSILFKLVFLCWLHALSQTSPLLNALLGKLLPIS